MSDHDHPSQGENIQIPSRRAVIAAAVAAAIPVAVILVTMETRSPVPRSRMLPRAFDDARGQASPVPGLESDEPDRERRRDALPKRTPIDSTSPNTSPGTDAAATPAATE
jgi:hypothetical protein